MNIPEIALQRMSQQRLTGQVFQDPAEMTQWFGAVQAQDYLGTLWSYGLRIRGSTEPSIEQAVIDRTIVRIWIMRGTIHFLPAADVHWMLNLLRPRLRMLLHSGLRYQRTELDAETIAKSEAVLERALHDGAQLTRDELASRLAEVGIHTEGNRLGSILHYAQLDSLICHGARRGKQFTFTLLDQWAPHARQLTPDEALAELTLRYFTSHGPATLDDFTWWSGLTKTQAAAGLNLVGSPLAQETVAGRTYWLSPTAPSVLERPGVAALLPTFDEYLVGYTDRSAVLGGLRGELWPRGNALFSSTIAVDGRIVGYWRRTLAKRAVAVETHLFFPLSDAENQVLATAVQCYADFLGLPLVDAQSDVVASA